MAHHHHHGHEHHHDIDVSNLNSAFILGIVLNTAYVVVEAVYGLIYNSMGLLSDAGHNLSDVATLIIAMVAFKMSQRKPTERYTYGYRKMTVQASLINALLLCVAVGAILVESISKLIHPEAVDGDAVAWVAGVGVVVNGITAWLFMRDKNRDLNAKGAFLHMAADALVSVGVVVSGIIIHFTGLYVIDPIIGIVIAIIVGWSTKDLLQKSMRMSLDAVPDGIDYEKVRQAISDVPGVKSVHHLHIWPLSTTVTAMTTHVIISDPLEMDNVINDIRKKMQSMGIKHSTIETETKISSGESTECPC
ncbi:cation diffusion facilitator family transporter [Lepagella muris]|jgi:cobalt-zinc-cadmium efflux system protein|uniref:Cation transporter n=1 Tax=Lepagella muris TaxID=3032870 RepID=A0AC61RL46_9BACT|nr:cation diffusion facilitator family transporter [Lepagella muris]ROT06583.1 cation transporter [Muribaculaceae bacterium Isolate-037 (Harlan)]TGY81080.1 cation transporter [Lepagella muris]THG54158.1 cation transporter [Bacteroidales bacterium]TKC57912.1 cation transporter [Bacteroidales bacterium]